MDVHGIEALCKRDVCSSGCDVKVRLQFHLQLYHNTGFEEIKHHVLFCCGMVRVSQQNVDKCFTTA